jgi:hypothetical protein
MLNSNRDSLAQVPRSAWRPLFWEPVAGTGERLMIGLIHNFGGEIGTARIIRDDVLDALYGKAADGLRRLIDQALQLYAAAATASSVGEVGISMMGLHAGELRETDVRSTTELLHVAALLYSSLANMDRLDELDESDAPQQEDVNRRFSTEVRSGVTAIRPELLMYCGKGGRLVPGGQLVKFGYFSPKAVLHFTVLNAVRQAAGVRDARARLFELQRARDVAGISNAALIAAVPRDDDPTLGPKQREQLKQNRAEIESEADAVKMNWFAVSAVPDAVTRVIEMVG